MEKKIATLALFVILLLSMSAVFTVATRAATETAIEKAIKLGVAYLAANQNPDGSWPHTFMWGEPVAYTGLAVLKLEGYAYELGYASPFDPAYPYHENVAKGLDYIFAGLLTQKIGLQDHTLGATGTWDNPDSNGNDLGVYGHGSTYPFDVYDTGIVLSAVSASGTPDRVVSVIGSPVDGWKYSKVAQDMADWLAWAQSDSDAPGMVPPGGEGGWSYGAMDNTGTGTHGYGPDNSNSGYAVLGLAYATSFGCTVPDWVKTELKAYITDIQDPVDGDLNGYDGGSWYDGIGGGLSGILPNILKTGNLIFEMAFVGDTPATPRVVDALNYLARHWGDASGANWPPGWDGDPANYQAMFTTMKGLEYMGITTLPGGIDWYADFSDKIVTQQDVSGAWLYSSERGDPCIITAWALLTLEKVAPPRLTPGKVTGGGQIEISLPKGKASFGFNVMYQEGWAAPKGELQYVDHTTKMIVHGPSMISLVVSSDKTKATFVGTCTINGVGGFTFKAYVEDNSEPGTNDVFKISLSNGYTAGGTLLNGNIQIHKKP
jgi:hypothetical protein